MATLFRRILIRLGKVIPFVLAFILLVGYVETIIAITNGNVIVDVEGETIYNLPITFFLANYIYIDWMDVLLVWILCIALELCKYTFRCAYLITLNLAFRTAVERLELSDGTIIGLCVFMALCAVICIYGGIKILTRK